MELDVQGAVEAAMSEAEATYRVEGNTRRPRPPRGGEWSESALRVLNERYLIKRDGRVVETPDEMCWRVACAIAAAEARWAPEETVRRHEEQFYDVLIERKFMPNSPTLMNAGTGNGLQYSACYVLPVGDSIPDIFDTLKNAAIIHQSGGGCISGDAQVFTTFCGVEAIATLYDRVRATGRPEELRGDHAVMDVRDLGIRTMALNPQRGTYEAAQVTHLWRYEVPRRDQVRVRCANGLEVMTSRWHPFMVFDGRAFVERRADELRAGDILPTPNGSVRQQWPHQEYREVSGMCLDEEIAWLLGYFLGDGSLGWAKVPESEPRCVKLRWRLFDGRTACLERARGILARRFDIHVRIHQDARGLYTLTTTDTRFTARFQQLLEVHPGPKGELPFPEMVAKSPLSVVGAFLAGLVDADGHVDSERLRVTFSTASHHLATRVHTLCSLLGFAPGMRSRELYGKSRSICYEVRLSSEPHLPELRDLLLPHLCDEVKSARLSHEIRVHDHVTAPRLPVPFSAVEDMLQSIGIRTNDIAIHRHPVRVGEAEIWVNRWKEGMGVSAETLRPLITALRPLVSEQYQSRLDLLERLLQGATTVQTVDAPDRSASFYDFTVAGHSTYLAGTNGLTAIHNTGFAFSRIRRKDSLVSRSGGRASGPVSFLRVYNAATEAVKQGGTRRGANMGILRVDHPDVLEFIDCKNDGGITNFNISVAITDAFMEALSRDDFYDLVDPHSREVTNRLRARDVWSKIVDSAWRSGDPGLVFIDRINNSPANPTPEVGMIEATNPCGEQPLLPNEACNLGSLNLASFVVDEDGKKDIDWAELERVTKLCVRFLDDVIEVNPYPLPEIDAMVKANRRIGLGIMGWADLLFVLGIPYDSEEAIQLADRIWSFVERAGHQQSQELAAVRGPFPNWERSIYRDGPPLRNSTVTTIAPTGTISIIADASSGIEPIFALAFQHKVDDRKLTFVNPIFVEAAQQRGIQSDALMDSVSAHGSVHGVDGVPADMQRVFVTAHEVEPEWHVRTQAAFQRHTDNGTSKTINLPNEATREDVERAYDLAWNLGCLGITVFRDGCKGVQVLNVGVDEKKEAQVEERPTQAPLPGLPAIKPRPRKVAGETHRVQTPIGTAYVTVNMDEQGEPLETFVHVGSSGSDVMAVAEALGRLISLVLRTPSPLTQREKIAEVVDQLGGIGGGRSLGFGASRVLSLPDALAQVLDEYAEKVEEHVERTGSLPEFSSFLPDLSVKGDICPSCGWAAFVHEEGCKKCHFCGHSEC